MTDQYYKDTDDKVHWLSAQDQANASARGLLLPDPSWTAIEAVEAATLLAPTVTQARAAFVASAKAALVDSDVTMTRVAEAVALGSTTWAAADVVAFVNWRRALRAIVSGTDATSTAIPERPAYPAGT